MTDAAYSIWSRDLFAGEDDEIGVKLSQYANAIETYVMMNQARPISVAELMRVFNTDRASTYEAIEYGYWLYLTGKTDDDAQVFVGVDGE